MEQDTCASLISSVWLFTSRETRLGIAHESQSDTTLREDVGTNIWICPTMKPQQEFVVYGAYTIQSNDPEDTRAFNHLLKQGNKLW